MGDWKLSMRGGSKKWELYNLKIDRCEMNDLAAKHPEKAEQLAGQWQAILDGFIKDLGGPGAKKKTASGGESSYGRVVRRP
jgi:arylsulfatase